MKNVICNTNLQFYGATVWHGTVGFNIGYYKTKKHLNIELSQVVSNVLNQEGDQQGSTKVNG